MSKIICIEGNIGSGKSTLLEILKTNYDNQKYMKNIPKYIFLEEPVKEWDTIKDKSGVTILEKFYENQKEYAFSFQMMAYISRLNNLQIAIKKNPDAIIIVERSVFTDRYVFASMLYNEEKINEIEYQVYLKWFDHFISELPRMSIVYVHTFPSVCYSRVKKRCRTGESDIELQYLSNCHLYHENMIQMMKQKNIKTLILDGNHEKNIDHIGNLDYIHWIKDIRDFIYSAVPSS